MEVFSLTHQGYRRNENEDRCLVKQFGGPNYLLAVADGMGGHIGGEIAAQLIVDVLADFEPGSGEMMGQLAKQVEEAQDRIVALEKETPVLQGMGSTLTMAMVQEFSVTWAQVGDSRLYRFHNDELQQITKDQNMAREMVEKGVLTTESARFSPLRNVLLQCIGCRDWWPDLGRFAVEQGDLLLLCTDGLYGPVGGKEITAIMAKETTLRNKAEQLELAALLAGGPDNITVVLAAL